MKYTRIISILITVFILLQQITFAFDIEREKETAKTNSQSVTILKDGEEIYSGSLDEYENGKWSQLDFSEINTWIIINWNNPEDEPLYIIPKSDNAANNQIMQTMIYKPMLIFCTTEPIRRE